MSALALLITNIEKIFFIDQHIRGIYTEAQDNFFEVVPWTLWSIKKITLIMIKSEKAVFPDIPNARVLSPLLVLSNLKWKHPRCTIVFAKTDLISLQMSTLRKREVQVLN